MRYGFPIVGISVAPAAARKGEAACCLKRPHHNPARELETAANFLISISRNPLKSPDSEK
jgi:hypothetical protein